MALRFVDGFDHYDDSIDSATGRSRSWRKWTASRNSNTNFPSQGNGRFGAGWSGGERWSRKDFPGVNQQTWICGAAIKFNNETGNRAFFIFMDSGTMQCDVRYNGSTKELYVTRNGTQLGSGYAFSPGAGAWYYLEFKVKIDNTTGTAEVKIDGQTVIALTGQDTQQTANAYANSFRLGSEGDVATSIYVDDLYVCDGSGSAPTNDFLGDIRIETLLPGGNGNTSQLVGQDADSTNNYLNVDDAATGVDDDTTYDATATVGNKDTYAYGDLTSTSGTVYGVQIVPLARKTDAGSRSICSIARLSGTEVDSADKILGTTYEYLPDIREAKPGGGAWSITDINNAEFGVKLTA